jgi:hypothetical protein
MKPRTSPWASRLLPLAACFALSACPNSDTDEPRDVIAQALIGPAGGVLDSGDGRVRLVVPPGALSVDTPLSVATAASVGDSLPDTTYDFAPDGTVFALPATLTLGYDPATLPADAAPGAPASIGIAKQIDADGETLALWEDLAVVDEATQTVTGRIEGFSAHSAVDYVGPRPFAATVTATYNANRTISVQWSSNSTYVAVEVARLTDVQLGTPGAIWPHESDYDTWLPWRAGAGQLSYAAGSDAALFYFRVRPHAGQTLGPPSEPARVAVFGQPRVPYPPSQLRATATAPDAVRLDWNGDAWATYYEVERSIDWATWQPYPTASAQSVSYNDFGAVAPSTFYVYRVRAQGSLGASAWVHAWVRTPAPAAPPSPTQLAASAMGPTSLAFTWQLDPSLADELRVARTDVAAGLRVEVAILAATDTSLVDVGLSPDSEYTYEFTAALAGLVGGTASITTRTPPLPNVAPPITGGPGATADCGDFELTASPATLVVAPGTHYVDISITRKAGFNGPVTLEFDRWCEGTFPLCEAAHVSFWCAGCAHVYSTVVGPGESTARLAVERGVVGTLGWATEFDVVAPDYPGCRATVAVEIP